VVLSLKGDSRGVGERDKVLLWIPVVSLLMTAFSILPLCYTSTDWNLCWFWLCSFEMWQYISLVNTSLSVLQLPTAAQPKSWTSGQSQLVCFRLLLHFWFPSKLLGNQSDAASLLSNSEPASTV